MRALFDTSVLVAALLASHPHHSVCTSYLNQAQSQEIEGFISTHSLAEIYSVLTRLPVRPRINPELAQRQIEVNLQRLEGVPLAVEDYHRSDRSDGRLKPSGWRRFRCADCSGGAESKG